MIDLHCHFLPGIDDGARDYPEALALARHAVASGITHSVLTPHLHLGRYENIRSDIELAFNNFQNKLHEEDIPLQIGFAAEVRIDSEMVALVEREDIPYLGQLGSQKLLLLELPHSHIPAGTENMVSWLVSKNIIPVIAHPERNKEVMRDTKKIIPLYNLGCLFQVTAGAVAGQFGEASRSTATQLLKDDFVTLLASDAHNLKHRPPELEPGRRAAEKIIGESASWDLVKTNPEQFASVHFGEFAEETSE